MRLLISYHQWSLTHTVHTDTHTRTHTHTHAHTFVQRQILVKSQPEGGSVALLYRQMVRCVCVCVRVHVQVCPCCYMHVTVCVSNT